MMRFIWRALILLFCTGWALADAPKPFDAATPAALAQRFAGKPYLIAFWSVECPHCQGELELFARLLRERPNLPLVLVSVDAPVQTSAVTQRLAELDLAKADNWQFADARAERLRFAIDRKWRGELPRNYLFDEKHQVRVYSGAMSEEVLRRWLATHSG